MGCYPSLVRLVDGHMGSGPSLEEVTLETSLSLIYSRELSWAPGLVFGMGLRG
jgi:hypothetical protein